MLIAPLNHPWALNGRIDLDEMVHADFILPDEGSETHTGLREALARVNISVYQLKTLITLGSLEAIALSVSEGLGVGFIPALVLERLVKDKVAQVEIADLKIVRNVYVGRHSHRPGTTAQKAFWDFLRTPEISKVLPAGARPSAELVRGLSEEWPKPI